MRTYIGIIILIHLSNRFHPKVAYSDLRRNIVPIDNLKLMYYAIVLPHFDYADTVYDAASETNNSRLQGLQTRAAQPIYGTVSRDNRNPVFKELGWLSFKNGRLIHKCTSVFKCRNGLAPPCLIDSFNINIFNHSYSTRNTSKLIISIARTEYYHKSFLILGCNAWNNLPDYIWKSISLNSFTFNMFKYLLANLQLYQYLVILIILSVNGMCIYWFEAWSMTNMAAIL